MATPNDQALSLFKKVGARLRQMRHQRGWTLERAAENAGMAVQNFARIEKGQNLTLETLSRLATLFSVEVHELLAPSDAPAELDVLMQTGWRIVKDVHGEPGPLVTAYDLAQANGRTLARATVGVVATLVPPPNRRFSVEGRFVARVQGEWMDPFVPDGGWGLFASQVKAPLLHKILLMRASEHVPADQFGYALRRVGAVKPGPRGGLSVRLDPAKREKSGTWVDIADERELQIEGEFIDVMTAQVPRGRRPKQQA